MYIKSKIIALALAITTLAAITTAAQATSITIDVDQDAFVGAGDPDRVYNPDVPYIYIGDHSSIQPYEGMFGFDLSSLTSMLGAGDVLQINQLRFNAYNNYNYLANTGIVNISLGNTDTWIDSNVTWNNSAGNYGAVIDFASVGASTLGSWVSWDLSSIDVAEFLTDDYLTLYLHVPLPVTVINFHNFESIEAVGDNTAYLSLDYTVITTPTSSGSAPEPGAIALLGLGLCLAGSACRTRRKDSSRK
jgi:hypothetical protein